MPEAHVDALYYDATIGEHCICGAVQSGREGEPIVVLYYLDSGVPISVPLSAFKESHNIDTIHVPGEPPPERPLER